MNWISIFTMQGIDFLTTAFVMTVGLIVLILIVLFFVDILQTKDAVRRNYPVVGRFRYIFSTLGEFFRQYFFAMDREEMPFNRAERDWINKSSRGEDNTIAFGSTKNLNPVGTMIFVNCPFPPLDEEAEETPDLVIGANRPHPYTTRSIINVSGMSYGALSRPAVRALSHGAAKAGCWINTGEGGLAPAHLEGGCDVIFQIGTAKYGVRNDDGSLNEQKLAEVAAHPEVKMFELKLSQGAKPGKGGILPGIKVTDEIAAIRGIPAYAASISPNRHPEIGNIDELLDFLARVRNITGKPTGFKTVVGAYGWLETMCKNIQERGVEWAPDFITVDSGDGGTGAAPMALMDNVGLPLKESLPMVIDILTRFGLRDHIKVICSGKLVTPAEVAWAYCVGADSVVSARGFMFALGCIQSLKCNKNTCPTGITTHDRRLQRGLNPENKAMRVNHYIESMRKGVGVISHSCGVHHPRALRRHHCRIVRDTGKSMPLDELYPPAQPETYASGII